MECFLARLQDKVVVDEGEDKVWWLETRSETFFVKSLYSSLEMGRSVPFSVNTRWNAWVPPKVSFFAWEAI